MFQLLITRTSFMVPVLIVLGFGVFSVPFPSLWLLAALAVYRLLRAGGLGDTLGYGELARLDTAVVGGLLILNGGYAIACRGVALSGITALTILTTVFYRSYDARRRPGAVAYVVTAFAWACLLYRLSHPIEGWLYWGCMRNNVG